MAHHVEPMDVDDITAFDNKENAYHHNNVLHNTEKGYEELDVSELNMKLRYSVTPVSSPMSKSYTASSVDNRNESLVLKNSEHTNLTQSLNANFQKNENPSKFPLQIQVPGDRNTSVLKQLDSTVTLEENKLSVPILDSLGLDENLSLSSSLSHTPEATTPTKEIPKDEATSPIMRGLKSVLNMFRPSQSPIPPSEGANEVKQEEMSPPIVISPRTKEETECPSVLASTPLAAHKHRESSLIKRNTPPKESLVFNNDLERDLQWNDETTIIFSHEKIPIHKLLLNNKLEKGNEGNKIEKQDDNIENLDSTVEYMDVSYNGSIQRDQTMTDIQSTGVNKSDVNFGLESDGEFVDCETTFTKNDSQVIEALPTEGVLTKNIETEQQIKPDISDEKSLDENNANNIMTVSIEKVSFNEPTKIMSKPSEEVLSNNIYETEQILIPESSKEKLLGENNIVNESTCPEVNADTSAAINDENSFTHQYNDLTINCQTSPLPNLDNLPVNINKQIDTNTNELVIAESTNIGELDNDKQEFGINDEQKCTLLPLNDETNNIGSLKHENLKNVTTSIVNEEASEFVTNNDTLHNAILESNRFDNQSGKKPIDTLVHNMILDEEKNVAKKVNNLSIYPIQFSNETLLQENKNNLEMNIILPDEYQNVEDGNTECKINRELSGKLGHGTINDVEKNNELMLEIQQNVSLDNNDISNVKTTLDLEISTNFIEDKYFVEKEHLDDRIDSVPDKSLDQLALIDQLQIHSKKTNMYLPPINQEELEKSIGQAVNNNLYGIITSEYNSKSIITDVTINNNNQTAAEINVCKILNEPTISDITPEDLSENAQNRIEPEPKKSFVHEEINTIVNGTGVEILNEVAIKCDSLSNNLVKNLTFTQDTNKSKDKTVLAYEPIVNMQLTYNINVDSDTVIEMSTKNNTSGKISPINIPLPEENEEDFSPDSITSLDIGFKAVDNDVTIASENYQTNDNRIMSETMNLSKDETMANLESSVNMIDKEVVSKHDILDTQISDTETDNTNVSLDNQEDDTINIKRENDVDVNGSKMQNFQNIKDMSENMDTVCDGINTISKNLEKDITKNEVTSTNVISNTPNENVNSRSLDNKKHDNVAMKQVHGTQENVLEENMQIAKEISEDMDIVQDELITSDGSSPFVSLTGGIPEKALDFEEIDNLFVSDSQKSPKIVSKGYNFNFDEMDDPFATKTKIRLSPTPDEMNKTGKQNYEVEPPIKDLKKTVKKSPSPIPKPSARKPIRIPLNNTNKKTSLTNLVSSNSVSGKTIPELFQNKDLKVENSIPETVELPVEDKPIETTSDLNKEKVSQEFTFDKNMSSSEFSTYYSAGTSSVESNPPHINSASDEIHDSETILPSVNNLSASNTNVTEVDIRNESQVSTDDKNDTTWSSKSTDDKNVTVQEIHTEDEDTIEGPFLELDDADKMTDFDGQPLDMMEFSKIPLQENNENFESGEMFIDAEAFEYLLNQNQDNVVADSGKESLFLKFDPLFTKRVSSSGVVAALNKVGKRDTSKVISKPPVNETFDMSAPGPSNMNGTQDILTSYLDESNDELNVTVSKPMMVVNPAVNPVVTPRTKVATPSNTNRRSITFTSPAIAVIDRLLSLSANNSILSHDATITQVSQEQDEADHALMQLRELLAEKEVEVYNLKTESELLKDQLSSLEDHLKSLEREGQERLKKINDLNNVLSEKNKVNKSMAAVVEEYERTIASLIAEKEQDKKRNAEERMQLIKERDEQSAHLLSMEVSFSDLHSKYEKSKQIILACKSNEDTYKKSITDFEDNLTKMQNNYELLKQHATSKLNYANQELEKNNKTHEADILKLNAMIKRKELHITSLEETLAQKTKANEELTAICDELINKVG